MSTRPGRVRLARLTDLAALGELSRLSQRPDQEAADTAVRSLGLPVHTSHVSVFSLFRMPLGAFQPHDPLYVFEEDGRLAGLARVERDSHRDEWTVVELDAIDHGDAGDIRFRLVQHLLRDGSRRGAARFHVACADRGGNVELFMQAGFARYGEELILFRPPDAPWPATSDAQAAASRIRPCRPLDAVALSQLYESVTPRPVARLEAYRLSDWERPGQWGVPRSSLTPLLRLADVEVYVQDSPGPDRGSLDALLQVGVSKEEQAHYLRVVCRPEHDPADLVRYGLAVVGERSRDSRRRPLANGSGAGSGVLSCVRTYESPTDRRLEEAGFSVVARVSLLMKEALVRVAEPALVPAIR
jgi:hypothetical protein